MTMRIDHVIFAAADLDAAAARMEAEHGLRAEGGGRHEGIGTENRIVPLGGGYIELLAVADAEEAAGSELGRAVARRIERTGDGPMGWAVAVDDIEPVARLLGTEVNLISRQGMTARLTGVPEAMAEPCLPFFIQRDPGVADPGAGGDGGGIEWIEVAGDARKLADWLGGGSLPVRVAEGAPAVLAVGVGGQRIR
jgi:Glyoxalase-like domain